MEQRTGSKLGKQYIKAYLKSPCFLKSRDVTLPTKVCVVKEAEVDVFLEFSCFFYDPMDVINLISGSSVFFQICLVCLEVLSSRIIEA